MNISKDYFKTNTVPELDLGVLNDEYKTPLFVPLGQSKTICFEISENVSDIQNQLEYIVFYYLQSLPISQLKTIVIDTSLEGNFKNLRSIKHSSRKIKFISDYDKGMQQIWNLKEIVRERVNNFPNDIDALIDFPVEDRVDLPFYLLLITNVSIAYFTRDRDLNAFCELLNNASRAGIYPVVSYLKKDNKQVITNKTQIEKLEHLLKGGVFFEQKSKNNYLFASGVLTDLQKFVNRYGFTYKQFTSDKYKSLAKAISKKFKNKDDEDIQPVVKVKIGTTSLGKQPFYLEIGGHSQVVHGLIAGTTGSGKSALLRTLIWRIAKYSPDYIRLYLIDFTPSGAGFTKFRKHPNVEILLLKDRSFNKVEATLQILEKTQNDMNNRFEQFANIEVENIYAYNESVPNKEKIPFIFLIVDEVQQLFKGDDNRKNLISIFQGLAKKSRKAGIHILFASQEFSTVKMPDSIKRQMKLRLSFQVDNNDYTEILGSGNFEDFNKLHPFEAIYNANLGRLGANEIFKADFPVDKNKQNKKSEKFFESEELKQLLEKAPKGQTFQKIIIDKSFNDDLGKLLGVSSEPNKKNEDNKPKDEMSDGLDMMNDLF